MRSKKFKIGDRVKCINIGSATYIKKNIIYTISHVFTSNSIKLKELGNKAHSYHQSKFELVTNELYEIY